MTARAPLRPRIPSSSPAAMIPAVLHAKLTTTSSSLAATSTAEEGESVGSTSTDTSSDGLSGGAIAGIVIGGLVAAALFSFLVMRWRRKRVQVFRRRHRATRSGASQMLLLSVRRACILTRLCVARRRVAAYGTHSAESRVYLQRRRGANGKSNEYACPAIPRAAETQRSWWPYRAPSRCGVRGVAH